MFTRAAALVLLLCVSAQARDGDQLVHDLRLRLGQTVASNSTWADSTLLRFLNMAQFTVAAFSGGIQKLDTIPGGSLRFDTSNGLNTDFIALKQSAWKWKNGKENTAIPYAPVDSFYILIKKNDEQVKGDNPIITEDGGGIAVFPILRTTDSLLISYYAFPSTISDTAECEFNLAWEEVVVLSAAEIAYEYIGDLGMVQFYTGERDKVLTALRDMTTRRPQTGPAR